MKIGFLGDWHGNTAYAQHMIMAQANNVDVFMHTGDFGVWPGIAGERYLKRVRLTLEHVDKELWFVDGNHEDFTQIAEADLALDERGLGVLRDRIYHVPRGHRWTWDGVSFMGLGGAVSLDSSRRTEGVSWWPEEELTYRDVLRAIYGGTSADDLTTEPKTVDVVVTHDAPLFVDVPGLPPRSVWPPAEMERTDRHRKMLDEVWEATRPKLWVHGHFHSRYALDYDGTRFVGLDCDDNTYDRNVMVWDTSELKDANDPS